MSTEERYKGYVVGSDIFNRSEIWKVRVRSFTGKDNPNIGKKFEVASVYGDVPLVKGLEVTFLLGIFGKRGENQHLRAIDVRVATVEGN